VGDDGGVAPGAVDFFVSYTSADRPWAEWIAWELEHAGHNTIIQAWDVQPGSNFMHEIHEATRVAARTIAVLSPAFLESGFCEAEWSAAFRKDPTGKERRLVPVRVRECDPDGLLGSVVYVDVVGLSESESRALLLAGVTEARARPADAPGFRALVRAREPESGCAARRAVRRCSASRSRRGHLSVAPGDWSAWRNGLRVAVWWRCMRFMGWARLVKRSSLPATRARIAKTTT
jgi:hypothetical protein